jgi:hypothetical protein
VIGKDIGNGRFEKIFELANLGRFLEKRKDQQSITIVSLGCGSCAELPALNDYLNERGKKMIYLGIDINPQCINDSKNRYSNYPDSTFYCLDASSLEIIRQEIPLLKEGYADLVLTRNAEIASKAAAVAYYKMILIVIPTLMGKNSLWITTFYTSYEARFVEELRKKPLSKLYLPADVKTLGVFNKNQERTPDQFMIALYPQSSAKKYLQSDLEKKDKSLIHGLLQFKQQVLEKAHEKNDLSSPFCSKLVFMLDRFFTDPNFPPNSEQIQFISNILNNARTPDQLKEQLLGYRNLSVEAKELLKPTMLQLYKLIQSSLTQTQQSPTHSPSAMDYGGRVNKESSDDSTPPAEFKP